MNKTGATLIWVAHLLETVGNVLKGQAEAGVPLAETQRGGEYYILLIGFRLCLNNNLFKQTKSRE